MRWSKNSLQFITLLSHKCDHYPEFAGGRSYLRSLHAIREMSRDNLLWGEERIANELLIKLGIRVSPRTVRKYMRRKPGRLLKSNGDFFQRNAQNTCSPAFARLDRHC